MNCKSNKMWKQEIKYKEKKVGIDWQIGWEADPTPSNE